MSNRAPASSPASKESLQALTKRSWRVERTSRNNADFNDCCGPSKTGDTNASAELLSKDFTFKSFKEAWRFMSDIAQAAERLKHHPEWSNVYNKVSVSLTTHSAGSTLTSLDIDLAEACDAAEDAVLAARSTRRQIRDEDPMAQPNSSAQAVKAENRS